MFVLTVAALRGNKIPTIRFDEFYGVTYFHGKILAQKWLLGVRGEEFLISTFLLLAHFFPNVPNNFSISSSSPS
jgi:hypothetical protein